MKLKMFAWPGLVLLLLAGNFQLVHWLQMLGIDDSPINIGGGSTYADAGIFNPWTPIDSQGVTQYGAKSPDKTTLVLHGLVDDKGNDAPSSLTNTGSWLVFFNTSSPPGYPASISFCSDPVMPSGFQLQPSTVYCNTTKLDSDQVYVQLNGKDGNNADTSRWERRSEFPQVWRGRTRLHFHNRHCDGNDGPNETYCDAITTVYVTVANDNGSKPVNGVPFHCKVEKDCYVRSGN